MHSEAYQKARKEFWNCIFMFPVCFGISIILAFTEWMPVMKEELRKEASAVKG